MRPSHRERRARQKALDKARVDKILEQKSQLQEVHDARAIDLEQLMGSLVERVRAMLPHMVTEEMDKSPEHISVLRRNVGAHSTSSMLHSAVFGSNPAWQLWAVSVG